MNKDGSIVDKSRRKFSVVSISKAALTDINEVALLFRALSWVHKASEEPSIRAHIVECMETIHAKLPDSLESRAICNVSDWCVLSALQDGDLQQPTLALFPMESGYSGVAIVQRKVREVWHRESVKILGRSHMVMRVVQRVQFGGVVLSISADHAPLFAYLIDADLQVTLRSLQNIASDLRYTSIPSTLGRFILELLCVLGSIYSNRSIPLSDLHLRGIRTMVCNSETNMRRGWMQCHETGHMPKPLATYRDSV